MQWKIRLAVFLGLLGASFKAAGNDETVYDFVLAAKASSYQVGGNLFADRNLGGWGSSFKLMPQNFGRSQGNQNFSWLGGAGLTFSLDLDNLDGPAHMASRLPFAPGQVVRLTWSTLLVNGCVLTEFVVQLCLGAPLITALYLEQDLGAQTWSAFSLNNSNPPLYISLNSHWEQFYIGAQLSSSYWNPGIGDLGTHYSLLQAQGFLGYAL